MQTQWIFYWTIDFFICYAISVYASGVDWTAYFWGEYAKFDKSSDDLSKQQTAKVHCDSKPAMKR